eukprot:m.839383 g.839383  ORF g.839383 m.839383 type:complete len:121 (-) comp23466_c0_seq23:2147-2509(-)
MLIALITLHVSVRIALMPQCTVQDGTDEDEEAAESDDEGSVVSDSTTSSTSGRRRRSNQSGFSTKPTQDEVVTDKSGVKSYQCLVCYRTFTHPPAFAQHKRAHGREAHAAAVDRLHDTDS